MVSRLGKSKRPGPAKLRLQNHAAKGITDKDFELAQKIKEVIQWQPGKAGRALKATPQKDRRFAYIKYDV